MQGTNYFNGNISSYAADVFCGVYGSRLTTSQYGKDPDLQMPKLLGINDESLKKVYKTFSPHFKKRL